MNNADNTWHLPPDNLALPDDETHVWRASLCLSPGRIMAWQQLLSDDELNRADRFHFEEDRNAYIAARGILRIVLGQYLNAEPAQLHFAYNQYGKPFLPPETNPETLQFNLSHSDGLALFAFTRQRRIGVDLERVQRQFEFEEIAGRFFSPREAALLHSLPDSMKPEAFFNCWTRKEAYIKAHGEGLSLPLDSFDVTLKPGKPARLIRTRDSPQEAAQWRLQALWPGDGFAGALAVKGDGWRLQCWQWPE